MIYEKNQKQNLKNSNIEEEETIYKNYYSYVDDQELKESNCQTDLIKQKMVLEKKKKA